MRNLRNSRGIRANTFLRGYSRNIQICQGYICKNSKYNLVEGHEVALVDLDNRYKTKTTDFWVKNLAF